MERMDTQEKLDRLEINYDYLKEENEKLEEENKSLKTENKELKKELEKAHTAYRAVRKINRAIMNGYV